MRKFKYWLVQFVIEIGSFPIERTMIVEMPEAIGASTCKPLLDRLQRTLFVCWPEIPQDPDEPCANEGTHRQTPWFSNTDSKPMVACVSWRFNQGLTPYMARKLRQAGLEWKKLSI